MSLREQFEALVRSYHKIQGFADWMLEKNGGGDYLDETTRSNWYYYQAGHAANTVNADLLKALRQIEQAFSDSPAHGAMACKMASIATEAIKKARSE